MAPKPQSQSFNQAPLAEATTSRAVMRRMKLSGLILIGLAIVLLLGSWGLKRTTQTAQSLQIEQIEEIRGLILKELAELNNLSRLPEPRALQASVKLGASVSDSNSSFAWHGQLYEQKLQYYLVQLIEALSRPISGMDSDKERQLNRESAIRLEALPKLDTLEAHINSSTNEPSVMLFVMGMIPGLAGFLMLCRFWLNQRTDALRRRINTLSRAIQTQNDADLQRLGASNALEGLMNVIEKTRDAEQRQALMKIGEQLEELKASGHRVLEFANSFHRLSTHATHLARHALTNEARNQKADGTIDTVKSQLDGLRDDMRNAAQGLRKAGQVSRQLMANLQNPNQMELNLSDQDQNAQLQNLVEQSQHALKEAIEGLVLASQKINMGQLEANRLAGHLAVNHTAWSNLLEEIEHHAESASKDSAEALLLAKRLIQNSRNQSTAVDKPKTPGLPNTWGT